MERKHLQVGWAGQAQDQAAGQRDKTAAASVATPVAVRPAALQVDVPGPHLPGSYF
jgi:hypothetical protein